MKMKISIILLFALITNITLAQIEQRNITIQKLKEFLN